MFCWPDIQQRYPDNAWIVHYELEKLMLVRKSQKPKSYGSRSTSKLKDISSEQGLIEFRAVTKDTVCEYFEKENPRCELMTIEYEQPKEIGTNHEKKDGFSKGHY